MYRATRLRLILTLCFSIVFVFACRSKPHVIEHRILQFGTIIDITIVHQDIDKTEQSFNKIEQQLREWHSNWHAWENGDLTRLNRALSTSQWVAIPDSLIALIRLSKKYYRKSNGLFNPALGELISAYGFHGSEVPDQLKIDVIRKNIPTMDDLELNQQTARSLNPYLSLDLGGIAKGYAIKLISNELKLAGFNHFLINAGGDIYAAGEKSGQPWTIGIQNPFEPGVIAGLELADGTNLFTSGNYQRYYRQKEKIVHHIIDPRSGKPSENISSVTVLSDDPVLADVAATTLMIGGLDNHRELSKLLGIDDYLIVSENKTITASRSFANKIELSSDWPIKLIN